jgi:hypothetical protein
MLSGSPKYSVSTMTTQTDISHIHIKTVTTRKVGFFLVKRIFGFHKRNYINQQNRFIFIFNIPRQIAMYVHFIERMIPRYQQQNRHSWKKRFFELLLFWYRCAIWTLWYETFKRSLAHDIDIPYRYFLIHNLKNRLELLYYRTYFCFFSSDTVRTLYFDHSFQNNFEIFK